jgi:signal transduction histidine kinase/CheY-like chemotaxis protein
MHQVTIDNLLRQFHITAEDIEAREALHEKLPVMSTILIEKFYREYLKDDDQVLRYFRQIDIDRLLKTMQEFIIFIFSAPIDQAYLSRIQKVGAIHAGIRLESAKVTYGFWALNQLLYKMSLVDPVIKHHYEMISKFFAMVEYIITDSTYYAYYQSSDRMHRLSSIEIVDEVYSSFAIHKENYSLIETYMKHPEQTMQQLNAMIEDPLECKFHQLLEHLSDQSERLRASGIDIEELKSLHIVWHQELTTFKDIVKKSEQQKIREQFDTLTRVTNQLYELMDRPLKEFSTSGFLSLHAGLKAIRAIHTIFSQRDLILVSEYDIKNNVMARVKESFASVMPWAIEEIVVQTEPFDSKSYDITKHIQYKQYSFYLGIKIKPLVNKLYLEEILILLLEALELNFSIKEREQSLMEFADKAESANRAKDVFLANMSHELRTPLNAINGFSQILMMRPDTPERIKAYVEKINIAGNNLLNLVNTILDFAKLEAGKMRFNPTLSNVQMIIKEVEILTRPLASQKDIQLDLKVDQSMTLVVDPMLLKQVLLNLISNAIKFTPKGGKVSLGVQYEKDTKSYHFSVCDTGIGISKEDQLKLFQPFVQIENVYQKSEAGSGLGLMICKKIVEELHRGHIWVESEAGKGSCFHVTIPTIDPPSNSYSLFKAPETAKHILIVEDDKELREIFEKYLQDKFRLTLTDSNNGAKKLLMVESFDLIILDFYLIDGICSEVLQYMEDEGIKTPVIVISEEEDLTVMKTLKATSNIESILNEKEIERLCEMLTQDTII